MPASLVAFSIWSHQLPNLMQIKTYAGIRVHEERLAASNEHARQAEGNLKQIMDFGQGMIADSETLAPEELVSRTRANL